MSIDPHKQKALELAIQGGGEPAAVIGRAQLYHGFLTGTAAAPTKPAAAANGGKPTPGAVPPGNKGAATAPKATGPTAAQQAKTTPQKVGAPAGNPTNDTKDPKGKNTFGDVCNKLKELMNAKSKDDAMNVLKTVGGADSVRNVKPAKYDAIVAAIDKALSESDPPEMTDGGEAAGDAMESGTEAPETDEMGLPIG